MGYLAIIRANQRIKYFKNRRRLTLELNNIGLTSEDLVKLMPVILQEFPNLSRFSLANNKLKSLPNSVGKLNKLRFFEIENNDIEILPGSIGELSDLTELNLHNNNLKIVPDSIKSVCTNRAIFTENPLSLGSFLNILAMNENQLHHDSLSLNKEYDALLMKLKYADKIPEEISIIESFADAYPNISLEEFNTFRCHLSAEQIRGIVEFKLPVQMLDVGFDSNGKLSIELPLKGSHSDLSILFEIAALVKKAIDKTFLEAFDIVKNKPEYLQGILNFGLSMDQMNQINSLEMRNFIYQEIAEKIKKINYPDDNQEMIIDELTTEDKAMARDTFNESIQQYTSQRAKDEDTELSAFRKVESAQKSKKNHESDRNLNIKSSASGLRQRTTKRSLS